MSLKPIKPSRISAGRKAANNAGRARPHLAPSALVLALSAALAVPGTALAADWVGNTTTWTLSGNWANPNAVPDATTNVSINTNTNIAGVSTVGEATANIVVGDTATGLLEIFNGGTLTSNGDATVGNAAGSNGQVQVNNAGSIWDITNSVFVGVSGNGFFGVVNGGAATVGANASVGSAASGDGRLQVDGANSTLGIGGTLNVGDGGAGILQIFNGGNVDSGTSIIGNLAGSTGTATVDASTWTSTGNITVGGSGTGTLDILNGGVVTNVIGTVGAGVGGQGTVTVDGVGSTWTNTGTLTVGNFGTGTLNIQNGGAVTATAAFIGNGAAGTSGTVTVDGTGGASDLTTTGAMAVGFIGAGTLNIVNGGTVTNNSGAIASQAGSTGTATVDGTGSTWTVGAQLAVGNLGTGTLNVTGGGAVTNANGLVGVQAGATGTALVSGTGSTWTNSGALFVGSAGTGTLTINNGGVVANTAGHIGAVGGGNGTVTVAGTGSQWNNSTDLSVGEFGTGTLNIQAGGTVNNVAGVVGSAVAASGTVNVTGAGALWLNGSTLVVGDLGTGTMALSAGGQVVNTAGTVGNQAGSTGTVTIDGVGSTWINTNGLIIGEAGSGSVNLTNGGKMNNVQVGHVGRLAGSTGSVTVDGAGSAWNNNASVFIGESGTGSLAVSNGGAVQAPNGAINVGTFAGSVGTLAISSGGTVNDIAGSIGSLAGATGAVTIDGVGSLWTNTAGFFAGSAGTGTVAITNGGELRNATGSLGTAATGNGTALVDGAGSLWTNTADLLVGDAGTGTLTIANGGAVSVAGQTTIASQAGSTGTLNIGGAAGSPAAAPGTVTAPLGVQFGAGVGTLNFNHTDTSGNYDFGANVSGLGTINQIAGWTTMSGDSSGFTGDVLVTGGRLAVNGSLANAPVSIGNGGTLGGNGTVGNTAVAAGGTIAPGNSIGTLNVNGNVSFAAGSFYQVETNPAGQSDKLLVSGTATINGGTVQVIGGTGTYNASTSYSILTAQGGVTGTFANVTSDLAFLDPSLTYAAKDVTLTLTRNGTPIGGVGQTPGQSGVGASVQSLGAGNPVYNAMLGLSAPQARYALQQLSGEVHASARSVQIQDSHFVRDASLERLRALDSERVANDGGADGEARLLPSVRDLAYWARAMGSWGHLDGSGGAATVNRDTSGFLMGADTRFGEEGRFGLAGGYSRSSFDVSGSSASGSSDNYHLGAYAGSRWGDLALRTGISYSWHDVSTSRVVAFPGFLDSLKADYKASTTQAFAELGYRIKTEKADLEPFASLAHVNVSSDGFTERGGPAALTSAGNSNGVTFSTVGLRASTKVNMSGASDVTARGSIAWRHAFGDTTPANTLAFSTGTPFGVTGAPVARNVAAVEAGLDFKLTNAATLGISYAGQFGSGLKDHGARINLNVAF